MITDTDIRKLKTIFAKKKELKHLDIKMDRGFKKIIEYIGETRNEIVSSLTKQLNDFRQEMRDIVGLHQSKLDNHEVRISHLEYLDK